MCYQRIQRLLTSIVLGINLLFFIIGLQGNQIIFKIAIIFQVFVIIMLVIWAFTNFCPSIWFLKKIFPPCNWKE